MARIPSKDLTDAEKRAKRDASEQDAMLREVDEAVRKDQFANFGTRYGIPIGALLLAGLLALGGWLWWNDRQEGQLEATSESLVLAIDQLEAGNLGGADEAFAALEDAGADGARTVARLSRAGIALQQDRQQDAAALYAEVAADDEAPQPYRDFATLREVALKYESMTPAEVEARIKPLATPGTPFFGSAAELLGAAYLDQGKEDLAGPLYAEIAKSDDVPESLRSRARQLAGQMGVDAIEDVDETLEQMRTEQAESASQ